MGKCKSHRLWPMLVIIAALIFAILASFWPQDRLADIIYITRFFDVTLPILAFGALIKYLLKGSSCCNSCDSKDKTCK